MPKIQLKQLLGLEKCYKRMSFVSQILGVGG